MNIKLRHLRQLVALVQHGSFGDAAAALGISQPALSRSLQSLEAEVGERLLDRTRSGVVPTQMGELVLRRGTALLSGAEELQREIVLSRGLEIGELAVAAGPYPAELSVGVAAGRLLARHPGLSMDIRVGGWQSLTRLVLEGKVDLAIAELHTARADERLKVEPLPRHQGYFVCRVGHPLARLAAPSLEQVCEHALVAPVLPERLRRLVAAVRVDSFTLVKDIVMASDAVGVALPGQVVTELAQGRLVRVPLELDWLCSNYGFITRRDRTPSSSALAFMDVVRQVEAELVAAEAPC